MRRIRIALAIVCLLGMLVPAVAARVVPGAIVIVDDWALKGPREAWQEYFNEHNLHPELHKIPDGHGPEWFEMPR